MDSNFELLKMSDLQVESDNARLKSLTERPRDWEKVVTEIVAEVLKDPGWLVSEEVLSYQAEFNQFLLSKIREKQDLKKLNDLFKYEHDTTSYDCFVIRFMEIFSKKYNFPYLWRGGTLTDVNSGVSGTYTFSVDEAKGWVERSFGAVRDEPCLIGIPVEQFVEQYKRGFKNRGIITSFLAEHNYDGMFSWSFDLRMNEVANGTVVYLKD